MFCNEHAEVPARTNLSGGDAPSNGTYADVAEKFPQENFRVNGEMREKI